jgi:tight adherence protein C
MTPVMMIGLVGAVAFMAVATWALVAVGRREARLSARLLGVQRRLGVDQVVVTRTFRGSAVGALASIGQMLARSGVLSARTMAELEQTLLAAGFRGSNAIAVFVGAKLSLFFGGTALSIVAVWVLGVAVLVLGVAQPFASFAPVLAAILGLLLPDIIARRLRRRYITQLEAGLSDALDLLVICGEAGLPLEGSIERVAHEIQAANRAVATEFSLCASELRILSDRRLALLNMADRTGLEPIRRMATSLVQSLQYGTPLTQVLRGLAAELRQEQLVKFEGKAAKLPVLLTVPMIVFILPTLFLVVGGPAMLMVARLW